MKPHKKINLTKNKKKIINNSFKKNQEGQGILLPLRFLGSFTKLGLKLGFKYPIQLLLLYSIIHFLTLGKLLPNSYIKVPTKIFETIIQELKKRGFFQSRNIDIIKNKHLKDKEDIKKQYRDAKNEIIRSEIKQSKLMPKLEQIYNDITVLIDEINNSKVKIVQLEIDLEILKSKFKKDTSNSRSNSDIDDKRFKIKEYTFQIQELESILLMKQYFYQSWILEDQENLNILNEDEKKEKLNNLKELLDQKDLYNNLAVEKIRLKYYKNIHRVSYHHLLSNITKICEKIDPTNVIYLLYFKFFKINLFSIKYTFLKYGILDANRDWATFKRNYIDKEVSEKLKKVSEDNAKDLLSKLHI